MGCSGCKYTGLRQKPTAAGDRIHRIKTKAIAQFKNDNPNVPDGGISSFPASTRLSAIEGGIIGCCETPSTDDIVIDIGLPTRDLQRQIDIPDLPNSRWPPHIDSRTFTTPRNGTTLFSIYIAAESGKITFADGSVEEFSFDYLNETIVAVPGKIRINAVNVTVLVFATPVINNLTFSTNVKQTLQSLYMDIAEPSSITIADFPNLVWYGSRGYYFQSYLETVIFSNTPHLTNIDLRATNISTADANTIAASILTASTITNGSLDLQVKTAGPITIDSGSALEQLQTRGWTIIL